MAGCGRHRTQHGHGTPPTPPRQTRTFKQKKTAVSQSVLYYRNYVCGIKVITNADVPLIRVLLCYLFTWPFYILRGLFYLHHVAVICTLFLVNLLHVMHGLISTYNYLISSCAYPGWALHKSKYGYTTKTNRSVNPDFLCCAVVVAKCTLAALLPGVLWH